MSRQHQTTGPQKNYRIEFFRATAIPAVLTLTLWAVVAIGSGCESHPQTASDSDVHAAQAASQQPDPSHEGASKDIVVGEQPPAAPAATGQSPAAPRQDPPVAIDRDRPSLLQNNASEHWLAQTNPVSAVQVPQEQDAQERQSEQLSSGARRAVGGSAGRAPGEPGRDAELVSVNFDNVEIRTVLKTIGEITGINFIPHAGVNGAVTVMSPTPIRLDEIYPFLQSILDVHGFATIEMDNAVKVVPKAEAAKSHTPVRVGSDPDAIPKTDTIVRQIVPLKYANATEISEIVQPILSPGAQIATYPRTNSLLITDTSANLNHIARVIQQLDVEGSKEKVLLYPLVHASASVMSEQVLRILDKTRTAGPPVGRLAATPGAGSGPRVLADERTNSLIVIATEQDAETIGSLVRQLDIERPMGTDSVHVIYLKNADANEVSNSLERALTSMKLTAAVPGTTPIQITPDASTNALVIVAPPSDFEVIAQIVEKLDIVREQVLVEMLILEVSDESLQEIGIDWATLGEPSPDSVRGFGVTNLGPRINFLSGTAEGLSIGAWKAVGAGVKIGAILQAMEKQSGVNILSTPHILASNHRKAKIVVGENRAFVTQSRITETTDPVTPTVIKSFEYKDVGITLDITPHVSQGGMIRLEIQSEFTKLIEDVTSVSIETPTTAKRTAQTVVTMGSGATVVIGGLIRDDTVKTVKKVPLLGDVPLLGALFRSQNHHKQKTNLLLFITPQVLSSQEELQGMTDQKRQTMEAAREASQ